MKKCEWKDFKTIPKDGTPVLVQLEKEMVRSVLHVGTFRPNVSFIGGRFDFDCPKVLYWRELPEINCST